LINLDELTFEFIESLGKHLSDCFLNFS